MSVRTDAAAAAGAWQNGTIGGLLDAIQARLREDMKYRDGLLTKDPAAPTRAPTIGGGWLPPKDAIADQFPFILIRAASGRDSGVEEGPAEEQDATVGVEFRIGTYRDADDGERDALALVDVIRLSFGADPYVGGPFEHIGPLAWTLESARPQWAAIIKTTFRIPRPQRPFQET